MSTLTWLFIAFMAVWAGLGVYLLSINVRQRNLERRLDSLDPTRGGNDVPPSHRD